MSRRGAASTEYGIIAALICVALIGALTMVGEGLKEVFGILGTPPDNRVRLINQLGMYIELEDDGEVEFRGEADLWGQPYQQHFQDCEYYTNAIPVLQMWFTPEQGQLFGQMCAE